MPLANDDARQICVRQGTERPTFAQMNDVISFYLAVNTLDVRRFVCSSLISNLFKLNNPRTTPAGQRDQMQTNKVQNVLNRLHYMVLNGAVGDGQLNYTLRPHNCRFRYVHGCFSVYGDQVIRQGLRDANNLEADNRQIREAAEQLTALRTNRDVFRIEAADYYHNRRKFLLRDQQCCGGVVLNGMMYGDLLQHIRDDVIKKLASRAYLHFYEDRGVELDDVVEAVAGVE